MAAGGGTLLLQVGSVLARLDLALPRLLLARTMALLCPLLFARHLCAVLSNRFHSLSSPSHDNGSAKDIEFSSPPSTQPKSSPCSAFVTRTVVSVLRFLEQMLEVYLWTVAMTVTTLCLLNPPDLYPCLLPFLVSANTSSATLDVWASLSHDSPRIFVKSPLDLPTAEFADDGAHHATSDSVVKVSADMLLCSGTCLGHGDMKDVVLLYLCFFPPLLLYVMVSALSSWASARWPGRVETDVAERPCDVDCMGCASNQELLQSTHPLKLPLVFYANDNMDVNNVQTFATRPDLKLPVHLPSPKQPAMLQDKNPPLSRLLLQTPDPHPASVSTKVKEAVSQESVKSPLTETQPNTCTPTPCEVCGLISPYVLFTSVAFLAQCFLLWPLLGAVRQTVCGQFQLPSAEFSFLPLFTAVCFVFRGSCCSPP
jgi:hypothetical protein